MIIPGNGGSEYPAPLTGNFYASLASTLRSKYPSIASVDATSMPSPNEAPRSIWIPHIEARLGIPNKSSSDVILVGHSSGAEAALRFAETHPIHGIVLVAACHSDLGDSSERASGWYPPQGGPWKWSNIKKNCPNIVQFHSDDDPFIPLHESRHVASNLRRDNISPVETSLVTEDAVSGSRSEYIEMNGMSHFFDPFDEIEIAVASML